MLNKCVYCIEWFLDIIFFFYFYSIRYINNMKSMPCCPLCHKDMNGNEVDVLTTELNDKIDLLPEDIKVAEQNVKKENSKLEKLLGLQSSVERLEHMRTAKLPKAKSELANLEQRLAGAQEALRTNERAIEDPRAKATICPSMLGDMSILDDALSYVERSEKELEKLRAMAADNPNDLDVDALKEQRIAKRAELERLKEAAIGKQKKLDEYLDKTRKVMEADTQARNEELRLKGLLQDYEMIKNRGRELELKLDELETSKETLQDQLSPVKHKLNALKVKQDTMKASNAAKMQQFNRQFDEIKRVHDGMERVSADLRKLAQQNLAAEIERLAKCSAEIRKEKSDQVTESTRNSSANPSFKSNFHSFIIGQLRKSE